MRGFQSSIQQKILLLLLSLSLPPLLLVAWLGLTGIARARETAVNEGTTTLQAQALSALEIRAGDKALLYNTSLASIQQQVESIADYAERLYMQPQPLPSASRVWVAPMPSPELLAVHARSVSYAQQLIPLLQSSVSPNPFISIGYVAVEEGGVIAFNDDAVIDNLLEIQPFDPRDRPWYRQAKDAGHTIWTNAYVDANTGTLTTTCATPIYDTQGELIGVVAFDLLLSTIQQDLLTVDIGQNGYAFLVNAVGEVIVRPDLSAEDISWNESFRSENLLASPSKTLRDIAIEMLNRQGGLELLTLGEGNAYIAYAPITTAGWSVALVIPEDEIISPAIATGQRIATSQDILRNQLIIFLLAMAILISGASILISLSFTRPIRALQQGVRAVAGGRFDQRLPSAGQDEIGHLVDAFNIMTDVIREKVAELETNARQLATLNTVSNELKSILSLPRLIDAIPDTVCERFGFSRAALYLLEGETLHVVGASFGYGNEIQADHFIAVANLKPVRLDDDSVEADVLRSKKAIIVDDPWNNPHINQEKQAIAASASYVQVPILGRDDRVIGLLSADFHHSERPIQAQDAGQLLMFANMVGLTIENVQLYSDLERQVTQRTKELRAALELAQLADRRKSDFLASISHELRTPLNAINGFSTVLLDDQLDPLTPTQREDVQSINRNGRFLLHLINELLDLAKIEAGHMRLEIVPFDLHEVVGDVVDTVHSLLREQHLQLHYLLPHDLPLVEADPDRVRQILLNLLSNAVKFTEKGSISVSAQVIEELDEQSGPQPYVMVSVRDTGVGIPADQQVEIFQEFVQLNERRPRMRGTGLGLSIVRKLVEAQRGRVWVDSTPGEGSTFSFILPVATVVGARSQGALSIDETLTA